MNLNVEHIAFFFHNQRTSGPASVSNIEKELFGRTNLTIETFAGSMAVMLNPDSLTFILTSVTSSEIISTTLDKSPGFSSLTSILIIGAEPQHQKTGSAFKYCYHEVYLYL